MTPAPSGFRRLALATVVATFALIIVGGVVRVSDSGLGCGPAGSGFHGWPFCNGDVVPGLDLHAVIEYSHRVLAAVVGVMIVALGVLALRRHRERRALVRATAAAVVLVLLQGALGGATVEENLEQELVAAHLGLAMLLIALLAYVWQQSRQGPDAGTQPPEADPDGAGRGTRLLSLAAGGAIFLTIVAGGYMAGTQNYGRADYRLGDGAHHACGREFPTCNGDFMPFGEARLVDIHLTHRALVYLSTLLLLVLVALVLRRRPSAGTVRSARVVGLLLAAQLLVGALNVWLEEYELLIVAHLALGTLLWLAAVTLAMQLHAAPAAARGRRPARRPEAVPA